MFTRRIAATVLTTALTSTAFLAVAAPGADAADRGADRAAKGCVTKAEYKKVKKGMPIAKVHKIFGTAGKQTVSVPGVGGGKVVGRAYKVCTSKKGAVGVSYVVKPGKKPVLGAKTAVWK
ncbi:hypothetical protein [Nocardioides sambongensis]|uniref:hypothetical protein n=1 Tax=Nocardioides sambongensis TaxID=2589074 RepID=UPI00112A70CA|nr:hypothetical protein [Nocardioides sambongensis]